jgi:hypothetical protein
MNMKSILLGTAAALVASGAYAADLPGEAAPAAVDYVKVCDTFGAGYFYIPGTDTCLNIYGRIRATLAYNKVKGGDGVASFSTNANVQFTSKSATDLGTLTTYMEFEFAGRDGGSFGTDNVYIQLGYVSVGMVDDMAMGDNLFNNNTGYTDFVGYNGDDQYGGINIKVDDLGGGFYAGIGGGAVKKGMFHSFTDDNGTADPADDVTYGASGSGTLLNGDDAITTIQASVGLAKQSWGSVDLSAGYFNVGSNASIATGYHQNLAFAAAPALMLGADEYFIRGTANFNIADGVTAAVFGGYNKMEELEGDAYVGVTAKYQVNDKADIFAGVEYAFVGDGFKDNVAANIGGDYTIVPGLKLQPELDYIKYNNAGDENDFTAWLRLQREY